jgi:hypothetical protein
MKRRFEKFKTKEKDMSDTFRDVVEVYQTVDKRVKRTALKHAELQHKQKHLYHRLLLVMSKIEVMRNKNQPISQGETRCVCIPFPFKHLSSNTNANIFFIF